MRKTFDKYEAAILLDACIRVIHGETDSTSAVSEVSNALRTMAVNSGMEIDDKYRNENGIRMQSAVMISALKRIPSPLHTPSHLFLEIIDLYENKRTEFDCILSEANQMIYTKENKTEEGLRNNNLPERYVRGSDEKSFQCWLTDIKKFSLDDSLNTVKAVRTSEEFAATNGIEPSQLYNAQSLEQIRSIVLALTKNKEFVNENLKHDKLLMQSLKLYLTYLLYIRDRGYDAQKMSYNVLDAHLSNEIINNAISLVADTRSDRICPKQNAEQCGIISNGALSSFDDDPEKSFYDYLKKETRLAPKTCEAYISSIKTSERYAADHGYQSSSLFTYDTGKVIATVKKLYSDIEFVHYNNEQHNRFSAAINKLLQYIGADIPQKIRITSDSGKLGQKINSKADSGIIKVMSSHYKYGFKIDSIRELMRFRQFAETMNILLPDNDDELLVAIKESGILIDGKVFYRSEDLPHELNKIIDNIFSEGTGVIYYSKLFDSYNDWMSSFVITSPDMLKEYLLNHVPNCYFAKTFFVPGSKKTEKNAVTAEIIRVWGESQTRSVMSLSNDLPYIPIENIWRVISGNDYFVLVEEGTYLYTKKIIIKSDEIKDIRDYVENTIVSLGFASLNDIPLGDIEEENYEIPRLPLLNALYKRLLSDDYKLNRWIMTKDSTVLDAILLLKKYLKDKEQCTFDELNEELIQLTGRVNRQYTFQALYDEMIRIDKKYFVSNREINFRVSEIDEVISGFITDHFISLKEITTFAMFPICGITWNHYVLESFCYKYSQKYSLHTIHFNDKNVGIIAEKDYDRKYDDMLAIALARSDIDLDSGSAGQYLFDNGYLAKTKYAALDRITEQAKQIRKER